MVLVGKLEGLLVQMGAATLLLICLMAAEATCYKVCPHIFCSGLKHRDASPTGFTGHYFDQERAMFHIQCCVCVHSEIWRSIDASIFYKPLGNGPMRAHLTTKESEPVAMHMRDHISSFSFAGNMITPDPPASKQIKQKNFINSASKHVFNVVFFHLMHHNEQLKLVNYIFDFNFQIN